MDQATETKEQLSGLGAAVSSVETLGAIAVIALGTVTVRLTFQDMRGYFLKKWWPL